MGADVFLVLQAELSVAFCLLETVIVLFSVTDFLFVNESALKLVFSAFWFSMLIIEFIIDSKLNCTKDIFLLHLSFKYCNTNKKFQHKHNNNMQLFWNILSCIAYAKKKKMIHLFLSLLHNCCHMTIC
jgi:hypothetical protein